MTEDLYRIWPGSTRKWTAPDALAVGEQAGQELEETVFAHVHVALIKGAESQHDAVADPLRASGGDRLDTALREIRGVEQRLADVERSRKGLDRALYTIGATVSTGADFAALVDTAHRMLADTDARRTAQNQFAEAMAEKRTHYSPASKSLRWMSLAHTKPAGPSLCRRLRALPVTRC
jgi:predicted negative regulator of RcsB-dependent stress response